MKNINSENEKTVIAFTKDQVRVWLESLDFESYNKTNKVDNNNKGETK